MAAHTDPLSPAGRILGCPGVLGGWPSLSSTSIHRVLDIKGFPSHGRSWWE